MRPTQRETRRFLSAPLLRASNAAEGATDAAHIVGYAAKFNVDSYPLADYCIADGDSFIEVLAPGCFARTLKEMPDIRALYNHDTSLILGRTSAGTLALSEEEIGLAFDVQLPDTQAGNDVRVLVGRGDITGCSFGFCCVQDTLSKREDGTVVRTILDLDLYEISPAVAFPAYEDTEVNLRSRWNARATTAQTPRLDRARRKLKLDSI